MSRADRGIASRQITRGQWAALFIIHTMVIYSVVPWRVTDLYSGGIDPVVIAKAIVGFAAFSLAFAYHHRVAVRGQLGSRTIVLLVGITLVSVLGAIAAGGAGPDIVLAVRLLLTGATIVLTVRSGPVVDVIVTILAALAFVALEASATGFTHFLAGYRLSGGAPQMQSNVLAGLAAAPAIGLASHIFARGVRAWNSVLLVILVALIFATGSRTALIVVFVGVVVAFLCAGRVPVSTIVATILVFPFAYALVAFTNTIADVLSRGQTIAQIATLNSRTIAWQAVLATPLDSWAKWIGVGLSAQTVAVQQQWRDVQALDSSWVSVIAQAGIIGTAMLVVWMVATGIESVRNLQLTALTTPLFVMLFIRSFTENGLIESSPTFVLFLAISLALEPGSRFPRAAAPAAAYLLAKPLPLRGVTSRPAVDVDSVATAE